MPEFRREADVPRSEFLRRTGALGIAGATALGFPLLETRPIGAAPLPPAKEVIAAGGGATIKIGHVDSFSGVYAAAGESQQTGLEAALDIAMKKNNRIKYVLVTRRRRVQTRDRRQRNEAACFARKSRPSRRRTFVRSWSRRLGDLRRAR